MKVGVVKGVNQSLEKAKFLILEVSQNTTRAKELRSAFPELNKSANRMSNTIKSPNVNNSRATKKFNNKLDNEARRLLNSGINLNRIG